MPEELHREKHQSAQQLRDLIESSQDWIFELDENFRILFTNPSMESALGQSAIELFRSSYLDHVVAEHRERVSGELRSLEPGRRSMRSLVQLTAVSGAPRWLEANVLALINEQGAVTGFRVTSRDVTDREEQQQRILRMKRILTMVSGVNGALVRLRGREQLLQEACRIAVDVGGYVWAVVSFLTPSRQLLVTVTAGATAPPLRTCVPTSDADPRRLSVSARAVVAEAPVVVHDLTQSDVADVTRDLSGAAVKAVAALPLRLDGTIVGVLALGAAEADVLDQEELDLLQELAANLSFALQYLDQQKTVRYLSDFDRLTGLANRSLFCARLERRLAQHIEGETTRAVALLDLERLGLVNDSAGRHIGDGLLQHVADRLRHHVEDSEDLAYLGSGLYALSVQLIGPPSQAFSLLHERIRGLFQQPFEIDDQVIRVTVRSGIACFPADGGDANTLLERAEAAVKNAKAAGESFLPFQLQMNRGKDRRLALEQQLRVAIEERQFTLHYQPIIDIGSARPVALEALLRWNAPDRGLVLPAEFLPVLEATHLIGEVGDWVLEQALADMRRWTSVGLPIRVAVNVSASQLRRRHFAEYVLKQLGAVANQGRGGLDIEITEGALLQDADDSLRKLALLRAAGVGVAIDDFGTGYSSLSRLSLLPVDTLKIDRSFVAGLPGDAAAVALTSTIIALARAFSLTTVAEGVERPDQLQILRELGCHQAQGYLYSRAESAADITQMLQRIRAEREELGTSPRQETSRTAPP